MTDSEIENVIEQDLTVLREAARTIAKYRGLATYNATRFASTGLATF
jgi:hypothetical protein